MTIFAPLFLLSIVSAVPEPEPEEAPVVVELFTSQSCSSCPPAEAYLVELAKNENIIALEWHVDYWDDLVHGRAGKWKDPFSSPDHTKRQREYNVALRGRTAGYTPQTVINGRHEMVGSRRAEIDGHVKMSKGVERLTAEKKGDSIVFARSKAGNGDAAPLTALFVTFQKKGQTNVERGENHGKTLREAHIVRAFRTLTPDADGQFEVVAPAAGNGCALILQDPKSMQIHAGAYCPS